MATPAAATAPSASLPQTNKSSHKRVFRSISRFLSGGSSATKQRPKLPQVTSSSKDGAVELANTSRPQRRSRSRSSSRSRQSGDEDAREHRPAAGPRGRGDSLSMLSAVSGADTDASLYAVAPSTRPPSSIVSARTVDSSSHTSSLAPTHASTHKSYASTKPTTLLSIDLGGAPGANRIAVVPGTGSGGTSGGVLGASAHSGGTHALSFSSALPDSPNPTVATPSSMAAPTATAAPFAAALHSHRNRHSVSSTSSSISLPFHSDGTPLDLPDSPTGVPSHTHAHPRNNPHPAFPPADNASVLTLASSSFAPSVIGSAGASFGGGGDKGGGAAARNSWTSAGGLRAWSTRQARSLHGGGGGSGAKSLLGAAQGAEADEDASVRALAGSRRASEESLGARSTWSAVVYAGPGSGTRPREGSVRSRAPLEDVDAAERDGREGKERRGSLRTLETAPSILLSDADANAETDVVNEAEGEQAHEDKGKAVDHAEHAGIAPGLVATAATFGLPAGGAALPPPVGMVNSADHDAATEQKDVVETATGASPPTGEKSEAEAVGEGTEEK